MGINAFKLNNDINIPLNLYRYNKYIKAISKISVEEITQKDYKETTEEEFDLLGEMIISELFNGNTEIQEEFEEYKKTIVCSKEQEEFIGGTFLVNEDGSQRVVTVIPNKNNIGCLILSIHEFIHYLFFKYNIKAEYAEILPILAEIKACYILDKIGEGTNNRELTLLNRINTVKWYYNELPEIEKRIYEKFKSLNGNGIIKLENLNEVIDLIQKYPWLQEDYKEHLKEIKTLSSSYGLGLLYSESLSCMMDDNIGDKIISILNGTITFDQLLYYYHIGINSEPTYNILNRKIKRVIN